MLAMASALLSSHDIVADWLPTMNALRDEFQETVNLGTLVDDNIQYLDNEENERGAACVAVALPDVVPTQKHAISISGPAARMTPQVVDRIGRRLREVIGASASM